MFVTLRCIRTFNFFTAGKVYVVPYRMYRYAIRKMKGSKEIYGLIYITCDLGYGLWVHIDDFICLEREREEKLKSILR